MSKLAVGKPADFAPAICSSSVRQDTFSLRVNYFVGLSIADSRLFGTPFVPVFSVYSERRSEPLQLFTGCGQPVSMWKCLRIPGLRRIVFRPKALVAGPCFPLCQHE